ncbi:MAG: phosphatase PAP2 family protein [Vicingaceae bacterium]
MFLNGLNSPIWDEIFYVVTGKLFWIPFGVALVFLAYLKVQRKAVLVLVFFVLSIALADQISVKLFKEVFERLRPCHNPLIADLVHTINGHCGGRYGFVSSHAANSFALAIFAGLTFKNSFKMVLPIMVVWAFLVSYSRVYVGVHYPLDVFCGGVLGAIIAYLLYQVFKISNKRFNLKIDVLC